MPALGGRQPYSTSFRAYSGKTESMQLFTGEITAVSLPGLLGELGDLHDALDAVTLGVIAKEHWGEETIVSNARPTDKNAQVESSMLVRVQGATTERPWSFRIPTIDYTKFNYADPPNGDSVIISGAGATTETTNLVSAIQAVAKMPDDETEAVVVVGMDAIR